MKPAASVDDYLADPIGAYLVGPTYAVYWRHEQLNGLMLWGRPDESDLGVVIRALEADARENVTPHASLVDTRRLQVADLGAFNTLSAYLASRQKQFRRVITRQAVLRPVGLPGAVVAGFYAVVPAGFPVRIFSDPVAALAWLEARHDAPIYDELEQIYGEACGSSPLLIALRSKLEVSPRAMTPRDMAQSLGVSQRSFQRKLRVLGTSFQAEVNRAQVRVAQNLMLQTNYPLKRIAIEIGCSSLQHFSTLFHKLTGEAPSIWRSRNASH